MSTGELIVSSRWDTIHENLLKEWSEICKTYSIVHQKTSVTTESRKKYITIPLIVLGGVTSSSILVSEGVHYMRYVNAFLALSMSVISGIADFLAFSKLSNLHQNCAFKYLSISMDIDLLLTSPRNERTEQPEPFMLDIKKRILDIRENSPSIPVEIIKKFKKEIYSLFIKRNKKPQIGHFNSPKIMSTEIDISPSDSSQLSPKNEVSSESGTDVYIINIDDSTTKQLRELNNTILKI